jgi:hypothetical protein
MATIATRPKNQRCPVCGNADNHKRDRREIARFGIATTGVERRDFDHQYSRGFFHPSRNPTPSSR